MQIRGISYMHPNPPCTHCLESFANQDSQHVHGYHVFRVMPKTCSCPPAQCIDLIPNGMSSDSNILVLRNR